MLVKSLIMSAIVLFSSFAVADEAVWIDVRTAQEHQIDNIDGDLRITHTEILPNIAKEYLDKGTEIYLYCRRGIRAERARSALLKAGYTNVHNAGGINDARETRALSDPSTD